MRRLSLLISVSVLLLAGCGRLRVMLPSQAPSINAVQLAGLRNTISIEIIELPEAGLAPSPGTPTAGLRRVTVTDPQSVAEIVAALDTDLPLMPQSFCLERYRLHFTLSDGKVQEFGYTCGEEAFLHGAQPFWQSMDVHPPATFQELIAEQIGHSNETQPGP